ncbi:ABC transporter permease [Streptomyces macrosporus]|uniref:ABC transporter permease n=1 Tax=Streptomyces macrosporus TaxID=44032 RepID=UPI0031DA51CF
MRSTHLGHAIASEWTKIRSVRSTVWTLAVMFVLVVGIGLLVALALGSQDTLELPVLSGGFFGLMLGQLCVITLGVLVITSEYSTGMIRTTLTACPRRGRVLTAKAVVFFLLSFVMTLVACTLTALLQAAMIEGKPIPEYIGPEMLNDESLATGEAVASGAEWLGATVGAALYVALLGLLSLAVGALLRSTPAAITSMLGLVLLPFLVSLFLFTESTRELGEKLREYSVLNGLSSLFRIPMEGDATGTGWPLLGLLAAVTAAALIGAYARISTRDV